LYQTSGYVKLQCLAFWYKLTKVAILKMAQTPHRQNIITGVLVNDTH